MTARGESPFVGPDPLSGAQRVYGRHDDVLDLFYRLVARRIVWLHSPSGAGKSSMIWGGRGERHTEHGERDQGEGLASRLTRDGFAVCKVRVHQAPASSSSNRYLHSTASWLAADLEKDGDSATSDAPIEAGTPVSLLECVDARLRRESERKQKENEDDHARTGRRRRRREGLHKIVLVFDQFEEVLTAARPSPEDLEEKREFFRTLGLMLEDNKHVWALFVLREDYLAPMKPYVEYIPTGWRTTFRLDLLSARLGSSGTYEGSAVDAITRTASDGRSQNGEPGNFTPEALEKLVEELADTKKISAEGTPIEPVLLQVACKKIWSDAADPARIGENDIIEGKSVDDALGDYYEEALDFLKQRTGPEKELINVPPEAVFLRERALREWFDEKLILPSDPEREGGRGRASGEPSPRSATTSAGSKPATSNGSGTSTSCAPSAAVARSGGSWLTTAW